MLYIRMLILISTILGYSFFLKEKHGVKFEFSPAIVCTTISMCMFFAGILNMFIPTVFLITTVGIVLFFYTLIKVKPTIADNKRNLVICVVWIGILLYFAILIRGSQFVHYDNFSHWALVTKTMFINDRMPNFQDLLVAFQAYPLGSSLFIYYVCKIIGDTEACYIFGQILMSISFLLPLLVFVKKKNVFRGVSIPIFATIALVCNISIYELLVDTLMPLAGVALFCIIKYEFDQEDRKNIDRMIWLMMPMSVFLLQVKNSGIFFCIVAWIYFLIRYRNIQSKEKIVDILKFVGIAVAYPLMTVYLWKCHVQLVYSAGETSKHAMSIENYKNIFGGKTIDDIKNIAEQIMGRLKDVHSTSFTIMAIITTMMVVMIIFSILVKNKTNIITLSKELLSVYIIFFLYVVSVFAMYIFSMPLGEAIVLGGYERYMLTVDIFCLGIAVVYALCLEQEKYEKIVAIFVTVCMIFVALPFKNNLKVLVEKQEYETTTRNKFQQIVREFNVPSQSNYLIYSSNSDAGYMYFMARYELYSSNVTVVDATDFYNYLERMDSYAYIIIVTPDENSKECLRKVGLDEYAVDEPRVIDMSKIK